MPCASAIAASSACTSRRISVPAGFHGSLTTMYRVVGRIAVDARNNDWRRGWGNDYRGYNNRYRGYDSGRFTCEVRRGRVVDIDYSGIRALR